MVLPGIGDLGLAQWLVWDAAPEGLPGSTARVDEPWTV